MSQHPEHLVRDGRRRADAVDEGGRALGRGALAEVDGLGEDVLGYVVTAPDGERTLVVANLSSTPVELPESATVLVASGDLDGRQVPTDTAVWATLG